MLIRTVKKSSGSVSGGLTNPGASHHSPDIKDR
jgi:hypothetical protein